MKNLNICYPTNKNVINLNRDHTVFFIDLINELKKKYNVRVYGESENAHCDGYVYELESDSSVRLKVFDCEMVIEDVDNHNFYILSAHDQISSTILDQQNNPNLKKVLYSQFIPKEIIHHTGKNYFKYHPWIYFKQSGEDIEDFFIKRNVIKEKKEKLYFKGTDIDRPILKYFDKDILVDYNKVHTNTYFDDLINYDVAFAVGGAANGDICYRDVEYLQLGIPFIKFEYITMLETPLIPNYHYISIDLPEDLPIHNGVQKDRLGNEKHSKMVEEKFKEVIKNKDFLKSISLNGRKYYEDNLSKDKRIQKTINLLNL